MLTMRLIAGDLTRKPEKAESAVRKWLTYMALLISAAIVIGDLICFVDYLLRGQSTWPFLLKILTVFVTAGGVFSYYLAPTQKARVLTRSRDRWFASAAAVAVLLGLALGFHGAGTPSVQRRLTADSVRLRDLATLFGEIKIQYTTLGRAPQSLNDIPTTNPALRLRDPETGAPYEYRPVNDRQFELCANFATTNSSASPAPYIPDTRPHGAGRQCFTYPY